MGEESAASALKRQVEALFFGTGVQELYKHWHSEIPGQGSKFRKHGSWETGEAPPTWAYLITATNPFNSERLLEKVVTYSVLYTAAEMIVAGRIETTEPFHPVSDETDRACAMWIYCDEIGSFDPHTLDEVLQVAVYSGIKHPHFEPRDRG